MKWTAKTTTWWVVDYGGDSCPDLRGTHEDAKHARDAYVEDNDWMAKPRIRRARLTIVKPKRAASGRRTAAS